MRKGLKMSEESKKKLSNSRKWMKFSDKHKINMSLVRIWKIPRNKWKPMSKEQKKKLSEVHTWVKLSQEHRDRIAEWHKWDKTNFWQWWISKELYSVDWTNTLKRSIRERDKYRCMLCWEPQWDIAHDVHHIDYIKTNCNPNNLITLCKNCHAKTNHNREYWISFFSKFI